MSFDDFLNHPRYQIESMIKVINNFDSKKEEITKNVLKNIDSSVPKSDDIEI
jgi:hypothetical protein